MTQVQLTDTQKSGTTVYAKFDKKYHVLPPYDVWSVSQFDKPEFDGSVKVDSDTMSAYTTQTPTHMRLTKEQFEDEQSQRFKYRNNYRTLLWRSKEDDVVTANKGQVDDMMAVFEEDFGYTSGFQFNTSVQYMDDAEAYKVILTGNAWFDVERPGHDFTKRYRVNVSEVDYNTYELGVNWSAMGAMSTEFTKVYAELMVVGATVAQYLNDAFENQVPFDLDYEEQVKQYLANN